jgi:hypothetical protein
VIRFPGVRLSEPTAPSTGGGGGAPTVTSVLPSTGLVSSIVNITITGTNLGGSSPQLTVAPPDGITVSNRTTVNSTTWTATLTIAAGAPTTARTLTITTTAGSAVGGFTVTQPGIVPNFTPNPNLALAPNEVKSLGAAGSGGFDPQIAAFSGFVYDDVNNAMLLFGGGHSSTNADNVSAFQCSTGTGFVPLYQRGTEANAQVQSNIDYGLGAWTAALGNSGPYPRAIARHTIDMLSAVNGELIVLEGVEANLPFSWDPSFLLHTAGAGAHYSVALNSWSFGAPYSGYPIGTWPSSAYVPGSGRIFITSGPLGRLDYYTIASKSFTQALNFSYVYDSVTGVNIGSRLASMGYNNTMVYYPPNGKLYYFSLGINYPDLYNMQGSITEIDPNSAAFHIIEVTDMAGTPPVFDGGGPNYNTYSLSEGSYTFCYDSHNQLILYGPLNGYMYAFNPITRTWLRQQLSGMAGMAGYSQCMDYDPVDNCAIFFATTPARFNLNGSDYGIYAYRWA